MFSLFSNRIFPILLVNFIGILGYSIVIPILIYIVNDFGGNGFIYGIMGAMYPFFQLIGAPILGKLSDRVGRKKVLVISQAGTFIAWVLFIIAFLLPKSEIFKVNLDLTGSFVITIPLVLLFLARIFDGFTGGNVSVANAYLSDVSTDQDRDKNFGLMGASTSLGFVLGPAVAGLLASTVLKEMLPVILAAVISLIAIVLIINKLPESNPCVVDTGKFNLKSFRRFFQVEHKECYSREEEDDDIQEEDKKIPFMALLKYDTIPLLYGIYFLTFLAFSLFYAGLPIYASTILEWSPIELGVFLAYSSAIMILVQGPLLSYISKRISNINRILIGCFFLAISFFMLSLENVVLLYIANTFLSIGNGIMWPSFLALLSKAGTKKTQGVIQGYGNSMGSFASIFGLVLGGFLFESIATNVFAIGGILFILIFFIVFIKKPKPPKVIKDQSLTTTPT